MNQTLPKMHWPLAGFFIGAMVFGAFSQQVSAAPLLQRAVPTKTSELTKSRDALYDAYDQWLKQDIRLDQLLQLSPAEARKRLDDAQKANKELQGKKQQYHRQLRSEYERMKEVLLDGNADPSPAVMDSLQKSYDEVLGVLSEDANNIDSQIPKNATDGPSLILKQGLDQTKRHIKDLQLTVIDQKNHAKKLLDTEEDARKARETVAGHLNKLLSGLGKYEALDSEIAKDVDNRIEAYRNIVAQNGNQCAGQTCGAEPDKRTGDQESQVNRVQTGSQSTSRSKGAETAVAKFVGHWKYSNSTDIPEKKGSYPVRLCDMEIDQDGKGSLRCQFGGVPASARSDVAFHFQLSLAVPAGSILAGDWSEGSASGSITIRPKNSDTLDVTWKVKRNQQEFFIVFLYSPITLSRVR